MAANHSAQEIKPEPSAVNGNEGKIRAAHLLIKHQDSRRPSSWREVNLPFFRSYVLNSSIT
jgi:NIMA-interacting peptidyl-prolyl cis-trans isomerase 1